MSTDQFNKNAQPVYCMFFPYKASFKAQLDAVIESPVAVKQLLESAVGELVKHLETIPSIQDELIYPPQLTEEGMYFGGSAGVLMVCNSKIFRAFEQPRPATTEEAAEYVRDQAFANAQDIMDQDEGPQPPRLN
ncbi:MAG: hypothetical protein H6869_09290 [Rhodospirillales bacterium]|nr:hypothetical protein [Rhodospirillales bacterium]